MSEESLDELDQQILYILQSDARNNTNAKISERLGVAPSTVGNRIKQLQQKGVIKGYLPSIDFDQAGYPLRVLFICTTSITDRSRLAQRALQVRGVVAVKELMTGEENLHIEVVGSNNDEITPLATAIDNLGITINEEILVKEEYPQPASIFKQPERS